MARPYYEVDVFTDAAFRGNPVAVVLEADGLSTEQMQQFANWTNLSETTFILAPTDHRADYDLRIFTASEELPFAGHPTLGSCHAWQLHTGAVTKDVTYQKCGAGLVAIRRTESGLSFAAPAVRKTVVDEDLLHRVAELLGIKRDAIRAAHQGENGPTWLVVMLDSVEDVLSLRPQRLDQSVGVIAAYPHRQDAAFEVRAFAASDGLVTEDPVTGSLNAIIAEWLFDGGQIATPYVASQGRALGRRGRVHLMRDAEGTIWVGGGTIACVRGEVDL